MEAFISDSLTVETISKAMGQAQFILQAPEKSTWDYIFSGATVVIALINIVLVFYIYFRNDKKDNNNNERNRKLGLLKTLVLDYNMKLLYVFYNEVKNISQKTQAKLSTEEKGKIVEELGDLAALYRQDFIDLFLAIDKSLYQRIIDISDNLIDGLTETIFDEGINLSHKPKFEELVTKRIRESKTGAVSILFSYSGD